LATCVAIAAANADVWQLCPSCRPRPPCGAASGREDGIEDQGAKSEATDDTILKERALCGTLDALSQFRIDFDVDEAGPSFGMGMALG